MSSFAAARAEAKARLRTVFGLAQYRPGQRQAVETLLRGRDLIALFPTGAGKSLCYQLPALCLPGVTLVVSPLIALMRDQVAHLRARGIPAACLDSLQTPAERAEVCRALARGELKLLYAAPERLRAPGFAELLTPCGVPLLVVDEAHCVAVWGESFRPDYREIGAFAASLPQRPVLCAMTATADPRTLRAIRASLGLRRPVTVTLPLLRENLRYALRPTLDTAAEAARLAAAHPGGRGVVFCGTRLRCERLADALRAKGFLAGFYHAGMAREARAEAQARFAAGELRVLCATSAFGMGVDIPDIRWVLHDSLPDSLMDLCQQSGRAGRDGLDADCVLAFRPEELLRQCRRLDAERERARRMLPRHPIQSARALSALRRGTRSRQQVLDAVLGGGCIPQALARAFGQRIAPCGRCSACLDAVPLPERPPRLRGLDETGARRWVLRWQRDAAAASLGLAPEEVLPEARLALAARTGRLEPGDGHPSAYPALKKLAEAMRRR